MRRVVIVILVMILCVSTISGCGNIYTEEKIAEIKETFQSFDNNYNFALSEDNSVWLYDKTINFDDLEYQGVKIERLIGCDDGYCYVATSRVMQSTGYFELKILKVSYDTLEMQEIGRISNLIRTYTTACRLYDNKIYISDKKISHNILDNSRYCVYDLDTGNQEWFDYNNDIFWAKNEKYDFSIKSKDVIITEKETGETKSVLWNDLSNLEEGKYLQQFSNRFWFGNARFYEFEEKNGVIYLLCLLPFDYGEYDCQVVIFTYDFDTETLGYYSSLPIEIIHNVNLYIVKR